MLDGSLTTVVKEELSLIEVLLVACNEIQLGQSHLCNLMAWYDTSLSWIRSHLTADTVGIADGNVEEIAFACGTIVRYGTFNHMSQIVELVDVHRNFAQRIALVDGENELEVWVTSTWYNTLVHDAHLPPESRNTWTIAGPAADSKYLDSGLIGPVTLKCVQQPL